MTSIYVICKVNSNVTYGQSEINKWKFIYLASDNQMKAGVTVLKSVRYTSK